MKMFGECEQGIDLPNIKAIVKANFKCHECNLKICGPFEIAYIKTKAGVGPQKMKVMCLMIWGKAIECKVEFSIHILWIK